VTREKDEARVGCAASEARIAVPSPRVRGEGEEVFQHNEVGEGDSQMSNLSRAPLTQFERAERSELPSPRKRGGGAVTTGRRPNAWTPLDIHS
jgi:hypothetical protein